MVEFMLVLIAVVAATVAIIVNRRSLMACVVIAASASFLCFGFLALYSNSHKLGSYGALLKFTLISSCVLILVLLAVTFIGVKMHFLKKNKKKTESGAFSFGASQSVPAAAEQREATVIPGTNIRPTPVGIFGRQPIIKQAESTKRAPVLPDIPVYQPPKKEEAPVATVSAAPAVAPITPVASDAASAALERMLAKASQFKAAKQFLLAEQMYTTYIQRCPDISKKADAEIFMLECRVEAGDPNGATEWLNLLVGKLRSGEYNLTAEQKMSLAQAKMNIMRLKK